MRDIELCFIIVYHARYASVFTNNNFVFNVNTHQFIELKLIY